MVKKLLNILGKIIFEVIKVLVEYTQNLKNEIYIKGLLIIFESILDSSSINARNSDEIIKQLLECTDHLLLTIINKLHLIEPKSNIDLFLY